MNIGSLGTLFVGTSVLGMAAGYLGGKASGHDRSFAERTMGYTGAAALGGAGILASATGMVGTLDELGHLGGASGSAVRGAGYLAFAGALIGGAWLGWQGARD